jgi:hypothetical protein
MGLGKYEKKTTQSPKTYFIYFTQQNLMQKRKFSRNGKCRDIKQKNTNEENTTLLIYI